MATSFIGQMEWPVKLDIQTIHLENTEDIIDISDSLVVPVLYDTLLIDPLVTSAVRKKQFINQVLPAILIVRFQTENKSRKVEKVINKIAANEPLRKGEKEYADSLMRRYRAKSYDNLLVRLKPTPTSLVLAQAAIESGWGKSRFALEGNNLFGIWTTSKDKNIIKSLYSRDDQQIYLKKYNNIAESIDHYFLTLGRHRAYRKFRLCRYEEADVYELIDSLDKYSEMGEEYTHLLKKVIEWNDLKEYDHYTIDPEYIQKKNWYSEILKKYRNNE